MMPLTKFDSRLASGNPNDFRSRIGGMIIDPMQSEGCCILLQGVDLSVTNRAPSYVAKRTATRAFLASMPLSLVARNPIFIGVAPEGELRS